MDNNTAAAFERLEKELELLQLTTDKTRNTIEKAKNGINSLTNAGDIATANAAATGLVNSILGSVDKFSGGNTFDILSGSMDLVGALTQFIGLAGPHGAVVAAIVGPLCSLLSGIFSFFGIKGEEKESPEEMLKRVVTEALAIQTDDELQSLAAGEMAEMQECIRILSELCRFEELTEHAKNMITDRNFLIDGVKFMARLWWYVDKDLATKDRNTAARTAKLVRTWVMLVNLRSEELAMLQSLYGLIEAYDLGSVTQSSQDSLTRLCQTNLERLSGYPNWPDEKNHHVYGQLHLALSQEERLHIEELAASCGTPFEGDVVRIREKTKNMYIACGYAQVDRDRGEVFCYRGNNWANDRTLWDRSLYRRIYFRNSGTGNFVVFNFYDGGYIYSSDYKPIDHTRHKINTWKLGNWVTNGRWRAMSNGWYCEDKKQYMYVSEYKEYNSTWYRVCTWTPGVLVKNGNFVAEETSVDFPYNTSKSVITDYKDDYLTRDINVDNMDDPKSHTDEEK